MRERLKWILAAGLAAGGLIVSLLVPPSTFECRVFTACHKSNMAYAVVSIFSTEIRESISRREEILVRILHTLLLCVSGAIVGFVAGALVDRQGRTTLVNEVSESTILAGPSLRSRPQPGRRRPAELELTGRGAFCDLYMRIDGRELSDMSRGYLIGREPGEGLQIRDESISRRHARLLASDGAFLVEDLGSTNGTRLNGQILQAYEPAHLADGDQLRIGEADFKVCVNE